MAGPSGQTPLHHLPYPIPDDDNDVPRDIKALAEALDGVSAVEPGSIVMWPTAIPPSGWHILAGPQATCLAADNPKLVALFGSSGGQVSLPDMRDRFPAMPGTDNGATLLNTGGESKHLLKSNESGVAVHAHSDTLSVASHSHDFLSTNVPGLTAASWGIINITHGSGAFQNAVPYQLGGTFVNRSSTGAQAPAVNGSVSPAVAADAAVAHENRPKFLTMNFIIKGG